MADKEEHVQRAKLAEQAERYLIFSSVPDTPSSGLFLAFQFRILPFLTWIWIAKILPWTGRLTIIKITNKKAEFVKETEIIYNI